MLHRFECRVYYDEVDFGGIVYYANYLKYIERARTEYVRDLGVDQTVLKDQGLVFAVKKLDADYRRAAKFDDVIRVETGLSAVTGARFLMEQNIWRAGEHLFACAVTIVCLTDLGKPARIPAEIRRKLQDNCL